MCCDRSYRPLSLPLTCITAGPCAPHCFGSMFLRTYRMLSLSKTNSQAATILILLLNSRELPNPALPGRWEPSRCVAVVGCPSLPRRVGGWEQDSVGRLCIKPLHIASTATIAKSPLGVWESIILQGGARLPIPSPKDKRSGKFFCY